MAKELTLKQVHDVMNKKFELVFAQLHAIQRTQREHSQQLDEIDGILRAVSRAVDKDAVTIIEYGRRISRLERLR